MRELTRFIGGLVFVRGGLALVRGGLALVRGGLGFVRGGLALVRGGLVLVQGGLALVRVILLLIRLQPPVHHLGHKHTASGTLRVKHKPTLKTHDRKHKDVSVAPCRVGVLSVLTCLRRSLFRDEVET